MIKTNDGSGWSIRTVKGFRNDYIYSKERLVAVVRKNIMGVKREQEVCISGGPEIHTYFNVKKEGFSYNLNLNTNIKIKLNPLIINDIYRIPFYILCNEFL